MMTHFEAGEIVFQVDTDSSYYDTLSLEINASGSIFVFHECDTESLVTYCIGGRVCIDNVVKGTSFLVIMDWWQDHTSQWDFSVSCNPNHPEGETCEDAIELTGSIDGQGVCTAGHRDDYSMMSSCGLSVPGADVVYKLCLAPYGELDALLEVDCVYWSAMYLFTDCEDPEGSCVAAVEDIDPFNMPEILMMNYSNGPNPQELYLAVDNTCDTQSSYDFGGRMALSVDYDPCTGMEKGACCFPDGHCEFLAPDVCYADGGDFYGVGITCDPNPCETTDVEELGQGLQTVLLPVMPNPFSQRTLIRYNLARPTDVRIEMFSVSGRVVRHLESRQAAAGSWSVEWDGRDDSGSNVGPGVYFCRMQTAGIIQTQRVVVLP